VEAIKELSYALDTFYFLVSGALVMWMAAGFAMLEAGLVRAKNTTEILTKNIVLYAVATIMYMLMGYSLMYPGDGVSSWWPGLPSILGAADNTAEAVIAGGDDAPYYSTLSDFFFQVVFVATAMSIVSGAVAERMKLWAFFVFAIVLTGFIYPMQGYWKWGGGFLDQAGFLDFAGSGVVHMCGGAAALAGVLLLGARKGKYGPDGKVNALPGANLPLATLGTFILWLGWFGFNGGSELKVSDVAEANAVALVFVNTNAAAAGGVVAAIITARLWFGKADLTMALNGALAGLVAITAEPLTPTPLLATLVGAIGGQAQDRRPGGRHLGPRRGRDVGPGRGDAVQPRSHHRFAAPGPVHHPGLGVPGQPHRLGHHQGGDGTAGERRRGIRGPRHRRVRPGGLSRIHRLPGVGQVTISSCSKRALLWNFTGASAPVFLTSERATRHSAHGPFPVSRSPG
jgi:Amt family ammonium transporter